MSFKNPFEVSYDRLPEALSVLPLDAILLLPGGQIPLQVFEPRYINMVQDALATPERVIGVILPKDKNSLYTIGCAGRITSFEETADGRFLITLTGYCRFKTINELSTMRGYRLFSVDWSLYKNDLVIDSNPDIHRDELVKLIQKYSQQLGIHMDWEVLSITPNFNVITFFSMSLPFKHSNKQPLLEAHTLEDRGEVLMAMIKDEIAAG